MSQLREKRFGLPATIDIEVMNQLASWPTYIKYSWATKQNHIKPNIWSFGRSFMLMFPSCMLVSHEGIDSHYQF